MDKVRDEIAEYLYNCDNGIFPDRTVIIEWRLASEGDKAEYYRRADQILAFIKKAGYVRLADDQSLPENPYAKGNVRSVGGTMVIGYDPISGGVYQEAQDDMLKAGFRRVEL